MKILGLKIPALLLGLLICYHILSPLLMEKEMWGRYINIIYLMLFTSLGFYILGTSENSKVKIFFKWFFLPFFVLKLLLTIITYAKINPMTGDFWDWFWVSIYSVLFFYSLWKIIRV